MIPCGHLMDDYPVFQRFSPWSIKTQNMSYASTNLYVFSFEKNITSIQAIVRYLRKLLNFQIYWKDRDLPYLRIIETIFSHF